MQELDLLKNSLETGKLAYEQEIVRREIIGKKADYLMKYLTIFLSVLNLSIPLILAYSSDGIVTPFFKNLYTILMVLLVGSIGGTLFIQYPRKVNLFLSGTDRLKMIQESLERYSDEKKLIYDDILMYSKVTKSLELNNNRTMQLMIVIFWAYFAVIALMGLFFGYVIMGNL